MAIPLISEKTGKRRRTDLEETSPAKQDSHNNESNSNNKTNGYSKDDLSSTMQSNQGNNSGSEATVSPSASTVTNVKPINSVERDAPKVKKMIKKRRNDSDDDGDSDDDRTARPKDRVFNSDDDDSDEEQTFHMTKDRREVFNFINKATVTELQPIKSCTSKKIDAILELRPFRDWHHMMQSFQDHKGLSAEVLNHCQDYLSSRNSMVKVMEKCEKICKRLESSVAAGGGLCTQPSILNPKFKLADYQLVGLNWLVVMHQEQTNGILADEMGLGKTIQVISFLAYLKETGQAKYPHLVVVPSSTLDNWDTEFARWVYQMILPFAYLFIKI